MQKIPTWLYAADGEARLFELEPGEAWPDGWLDSPGAWSEVKNEPGEPAGAPDETGEAAGEGVASDGAEGVQLDETDPADGAAQADTGVSEANTAAENAGSEAAVNQAVDDLANIIASQDKVALDAFAAKQGIQLDRRKSFGKMVADYREAISR